ncbi:hypothetical protein GJAV_G00007340 [Gymnothorax javanicus]|nr:hypothetical protein GJAV_G00007340 [Gymnothorax javanicus]
MKQVEFTCTKADMPQAFYLVLFVLFCTEAVSCSTLFASTNETVTLKCECANKRGCYENFVRWVRMSLNGSLQIIDTAKCENSPCRFRSKREDHVFVALTITQVELGDSGRYYCGEHLSSYVQFTDNGSVLMVGDVWTDTSEVHMLNELIGKSENLAVLDWTEAEISNIREELKSEWKYETEKESKLDLSDFQDVKHTELRCVITGLRAPWVNVFWQSSQGSWKKQGKTSSFMNTGRGYTVESSFRIGLKDKMDWENEDELHRFERHVNAKLNFDQMVEMDEELWCDIQVGVNFSMSTPTFSFRQQIENVPEWCDQLLYGEIALCAFCVCVLSLLTFHCMHCHHKGPDPSAMELSPTSGPSGEVSITYAQLDIRKQPRKERHRHKNQQEDKLVYSEVRYKPA